MDGLGSWASAGVVGHLEGRSCSAVLPVQVPVWTQRHVHIYGMQLCVRLTEKQNEGRATEPGRQYRQPGLQLLSGIDGNLMRPGPAASFTPACLNDSTVHISQLLTSFFLLRRALLTASC